ncbi:MAG: GTPase Era [Rhodobacteraceae bacterium]|nr:GTPase Era [Paracoccaceae bacterium]
MATRAGFVALLGEPNAGKSTLTNRLVGARVSAVTHKRQTTRARIRGIATWGGSQMVIVDTPGVFCPERRLERAMTAAAWNEANGGDVVLVVVPAHRRQSAEWAHLLHRLTLLDKGRRSRIPKVLVINKVDLIKPPQLLPLAEALNGQFPFAATFMVSALRGRGLRELKDWLARAMPRGPWLYPAEQQSDVPLPVMAADITWEKLMLRLHEELPYALTVETGSCQECGDGAVRIEQDVYVMRESHKSMALGKGGQVVKSISMAARQELERRLGRRVHLFLRVKLRPGWQEEAVRYENMGLRFRDGDR